MSDNGAGKISLIITGPKVHEVGYRYWLMNQAMALGIEGFNAINLVDADANFTEYPGSSKGFADIQEKVSVLPEIRDSTAETAESLREDRMARMERDIRTIKAKLGMA